MWVAFVVLFDNGWSSSSNAASIALWMPMILLGGLSAALSAAAVVRAKAAARSPVVEVSPRGKVLLELLQLASDIVFLALLPYAVVATTILAGSRIGGAQGRLDLHYLWFTALYCVFLVLLGRAVAEVVSGPVLAPVFAFVAALIFGAYSILTGSEINAWSVFDVRAYVLLAVITTIIMLSLIVARLKSESLGIVATTVGILASGTLVWAMGSIDMGALLRTPEGRADVTCRDVDKDSVCVWPEDAHKLDELADQIRRMRALGDAAGVTMPAMTFAEPGLDTVVPGARQIIPLGGKVKSWAAAQSITMSLFDQGCPGAADDPDLDDSAYLVQDLSTNFVFGDIEYGGYASSLPQVDDLRSQRSAQLAPQTQEAQAKQLGEDIMELRSQCGLSEGSGR